MKRNIRFIAMICLLFLFALTIAGCKKEEETVVPEEELITNDAGETQTKDIDDVKKPRVEKIISTSIEKVTLPPVAKQKLENELQDEFEKGSYTFEAPLVKEDPYKNSPLTALVLFTTEESCQVKVTVKGKDSKSDITGKLKATKEHRIPVIGLYPNKKNKVVLELLNDAGKMIKKKMITIQTKELPKSMKDVVRVEKHAKKSAYHLTMISGQSTPYPFAYDENGDVRWYLATKTEDYGIFPMSDQKFMLQSKDSLTLTEEKAHTTEIHEMDYLGRIYQIYYVKKGYHHEVIEKVPGGNLLVLSSSIDGHVEDTVQEIDRETGKIVKTLDMRDLFDKTYINKVDWAHLNTASYNEKTDSVLLSPRNIHSAIKVDWSTNKLKWILCNPKFFEGTEQESKVLKPIGNIKWHFQQHSVYEIPDDLDNNPDTIHIMLLDNHWQTKRKVDYFDNDPNTYVSIYTIDEKKMTVKQEHIYAGEKSKITSNCSYDNKMKRVFAFNGYLDPLIQGRKGMVLEYDYKSENVFNKYSFKYYFYRGYEMQINYDILSEPMNIGTKYVKGVLQAPGKVDQEDVPDKKLERGKASFAIKGSVLYMTCKDHWIMKVRFIGKNQTYMIDYTKAEGDGSGYRNVTYPIAIPIGQLTQDTYQIVVRFGDTWMDTGKSFTINK